LYLNTYDRRLRAWNTAYSEAARESRRAGAEVNPEPPAPPATAQFPAPVETARAALQAARRARVAQLLEIYTQNPRARTEEVARDLRVTRQTVSAYLTDLETRGIIRRNGHGVEILEDK
jgi:DNA invertase Pin-like site-specific DNA recombinase